MELVARAISDVNTFSKSSGSGAPWMIFLSLITSTGTALIPMLMCFWIFALTSFTSWSLSRHSFAPVTPARSAAPRRKARSLNGMFFSWFPL